MGTKYPHKDVNISNSWEILVDVSAMDRFRVIEDIMNSLLYSKNHYDYGK